MGKFLVNGYEVSEATFDAAMDKVREIDPVLADAIEGAATYKDGGE